MKAIYLFTSILLLGTASALFGQEARFFIPREVVQAYENGTRSYDGRPGANYWQNLVDYDIEVEVIPSEKKLRGAEKVTLITNESMNKKQFRKNYQIV